MIGLLDFIHFGPTEMVILLVITLVLVGVSRLPHLMRSLQEGLRHFKKGMQQGELWQFNDGRQRQFDGPPKSTPQGLPWLTLTSAGFLLVLSAYPEGAVSVKQALVALGVFAAVGLTGWFCFGKERN